ncbi:MAG: hypothetical protein JW787_05740 [Sedimentisphaerales bacterium]|nr:hypothetical protein [Sedimentisphaerales bacterium]
MKTKSSKRRGEKLLSLMLVLVTACLWNSEAFSMDLMGPPTASLEQGWFNAGIEYTNTKMDLELYNGVYSEYLDGIFDNWGEALDITLKDLKINRTYARVGYGITDNAEVFLRLGGMNAKFGDAIWEDSEKFSSGAEFAAGAGVKLTFYEEDNLKLGGLFQFNGASFDGQLEASHWASSDFVEVDIGEVQLAVGASCECNEHLTIYGGPFLHFVGGQIDDQYSEVDSGTGGLLTSKYSWDIEEDSVFGGYFGAQMNFNENCSFNLEYQQTSDARAFGIGLIFKF